MIWCLGFDLINARKKEGGREGGREREEEEERERKKEKEKEEEEREEEGEEEKKKRKKTERGGGRSRRREGGRKEKRKGREMEMWRWRRKNWNTTIGNKVRIVDGQKVQFYCLCMNESYLLKCFLLLTGIFNSMKLAPNCFQTMSYSLLFVLLRSKVNNWEKQKQRSEEKQGKWLHQKGVGT